jgi:hypothetical protein
MRIITRILSIVLIVTIPTVALCIGINAAARLPDVYQYQFKSTDTLDSMGLELTNDEMGGFISGFMVGRADTFQLWTGDEEKPQAVFTEEELAAMAQIRHYINMVAIIGIALIILLISSFVMLKRKEMNRDLRKYYCRSLAAYIILLAIFVTIKIVVLSGNFTIWDLTDYVFEEGTTEILPQLITASLVKSIGRVALVISAILMAVIGYTTYKITAPKRIFSRS